MNKRAQSPEQAITNVTTTFFNKLRSLESIGHDIDNIRSTLDRLDEQYGVYSEEASRLNYLISTVEIGLNDILDDPEIEEIIKMNLSGRRPNLLRGAIELMAQEIHFSDDEIREKAESIGMDLEEVDFDQLKKGVQVELEHGSKDPDTDVTGDDLEATVKIAWAHLKELPDYYDRLAEMERS